MVDAETWLPPAGQGRYWRLRRKGGLYEMHLRERGTFLNWTVHKVMFSCADRQLRECAAEVARRMLDDPKTMIGDWY